MNKMAKAEEFYQKAIQATKAPAYTYYQALYYEITGRFYMNWSEEKAIIGHAYLKEAYQLYHSYGADRKLEHLRRFFDIVSPAVCFDYHRV